MALTKTGAALKGYGNSYSETIGLITAGTEMLPNQASKVARGWRTIGANILKLAQDEEVLQVANGKVNISLRDSEGNMKSTYQILKQLSEGTDEMYHGVKLETTAWKDLSEEEQSSISLMLAGKTQTEVFKSTMDNYTQAIKANTTAQNSQNSASKENAKYLDSIEGKLQAFRSAWEQLSYHLVDSSTIKTVIGFATTLITVLDKIVEVVDKLPKPLSTVIGLLTAFGTIVGGLKLLNFAEGFTAIGKAAKSLTGAVEGVGEAASVAGGAKGLGALKSAIGFLTNPVVLGGLAALAVAVAAIKIDKYFSFEESLKRLNEYEDKLKTVTSEIEALKEKRDSDSGLTDAEKTHLAVLEAEERSLERQIELEKQRVKNAFVKDANSKQGKTYQERTGPTELLDYNDALDKQISKYKELQKLKNTVDVLSWKKDNGTIKPEELELLEKADKQLRDMSDDYVELKAKTSEAGSALTALYEQVKNAFPYEEMDEETRKAFDDMHKGVLTNQIAVDGLTGSYTQFVDTLNSLIDANGFDGLINFDDIDIGSLQSAEELIAAVKEQIMGLDDETEIKIQAKDETGKVLGDIEGKKSDFTDEAWDIILKAQTTGDWSKVQEYLKEHPEVEFKFTESGASEISEKKDEITEPSEAEIKVRQEGLEEFMAGKHNAMLPGTTPITVTDNGTAGQTKGQIDAIKGHNVDIPVNQSGEKTSGIQSKIDSVQGKDVHINIFKTIWESVKKKAKGKRKGEQGGMAWLGDEGTRNNPKPELVVGEDGAYLAGTEGWEMRNLKSSDTVYTYAQTKKLLSGKQTFSGVASELPRFKKGKKAKKKTAATNANVKKASNKVKKAKNKSTKKKAKKNLEKLKKQRDKKRSAFDKELEKLKHKAKVNHWTDAKYQKEYKKLYKKYKAYLSGDQSDDYTESREDYENERDTSEFEKLIEDVTPETLADLTSRINANDNLSDDEKAELIEKANEAANKVGHDRAEKEFDRRTGLISATGTTGLTGLVKDIQGNKYLSAEEKKDAIAKAYQTAVEYNLKEYKNGKATRDDILRDIQNYYNTRGEYDEEYYKMVDELREADKEKELKRLEELEKKEADKLTYMKKYAQRQKDAIDEQIKKEKEEADALEKLTELQDKLNNAKKTMIKVYKEGEGFVYVQDTQAIREAQKALDDYNKEHKKSELEEKAEAWQKIIDAIGEAEDLSEMKELELNLGITDISQITGNIGLDANKWGALAKIILATEMGIADIAKVLSEANGADIEALIGATLSSGNKTISDAILNQYIGKHSFASGTLSSPSGFSLVGENGPELRYLSGGSTIFPSGISRNLMEWGQYSPAQVLSSMLGGSNNQIFNFDKIVLPNVHNADEFYKELQALPNRAIQQSTFRM